MKIKVVVPAIVLAVLCCANVSAKDALKLTSPVMEEGGTLPVLYTCEGKAISPPLSWSGVPAAAKSLVFIMDHQPHPGPGPQKQAQEQTQTQADSNKATAAHRDPQSQSTELRWYWTLYNVPVSASKLDAGQSLGILGSNIVNNENAYAPPCSKGPGLKRYTIHLYALSDVLTLSDPKKVSEAVLRKCMQNLVLDSASLSVEFERSATQENPEKGKNPPPLKHAANNIPAVTCQ
ncbi:MAG: phosphatidylethanolamine-binding protein (PEBP) family uncharacterized protein [Psychromonas sp.]|jgi:phosphatidylethanolamine-binding protein (PEBP) family uncharacterized protein|uniref:YbhB/YbcL family Raf kinase inhibitor-like protein n=1 Tax=Psychromonas sp. TaxID=1884585 RepID=UPI0039E51F2F